MKSVILIGIVLLLGITQAAFAESKTFSVTCTIPAIPGVNAPAIDGTISDEQAANEATEQEENAPLSQDSAPAMIQEDSNNIVLANQDNSQRNVRTVYSR